MYKLTCFPVDLLLFLFRRKNGFNFFFSWEVNRLDTFGNLKLTDVCILEVKQKSGWVHRGYNFTYRVQIRVANTGFGGKLRPYFSSTSLENPQKPQHTEAANADIKFTDLILMFLISSYKNQKGYWIIAKRSSAMGHFWLNKFHSASVISINCISNVKFSF